LGNFANVGVWTPLPLERGGPRDARSLVVTGRLAGAATVEAAAAEVAGLARQLELESPATNRGRGVSVRVSNRAIGGPNFWIVIALLISAVTLIMLIASANVTGVLLARAAARQREFGLRVALGARRSRIFRQLLAEGLLLAVLGGAGGLGAAEAGLRLIRSIEAEEIFRQIVVDWHEVAFVALLAIVTPLVFSLAPALAALRSNLPSLLNAGGPRIAASAGRGRRLLVVAQLALAVTFVTVAGLVLRTATAMATAPTGFDPSRLLQFTLTFDDAAHRGAVARRQVVREIEARLEQTAGVLSTGALDALPAVAIEATVPLEIDGRPNAEGEPAPWAHVVTLDAGGLEALGIPLLAGRALTQSDGEIDADVALVSSAAASRYFGSVDRAIGRRLKVRVQGAIRDRQIVGVTGDARYAEPERGMPPRVWVPLAEPHRVSIVVRASGDPGALAPAVRQIAREVVPSLPIEGLETYDAAIARRMGSDRIIVGMMLSFALVALLFATTGLYGIVAFNTSQRFTEFGTRFALGAQVRDVVALVLGQAFRLLAVGLAIGLLGGLAVARAMRSTLYGVSPTDPLNLIVVVILLSLVTLVASVMPAWRAARIGIASALRGD
jgi:putative ABC transport system permease protein